MKSSYLTVVLILALIVACERQQNFEEFDDSKFGYDYFPLEDGRYWIYDVDSTVYDDIGTTITKTSSQVKEEIVDHFEDEAGDIIYRIERYWRAEAGKPWQITDVWVTFRNDEQAFRTEENLKFVKFVFPAILGTSWNGNIYFDERTEITVAGERLEMFKDWNDYRLESLDESEEVGGISYDNVATVLQTDDLETSKIERRYSLEKYARGVGLIYKENIILDTQQSDNAAPWEEKAESGFILKQTLVEHN